LARPQPVPAGPGHSSAGFEGAGPVDAGVVTGGQRVEAEPPGPLEEGPELDVPVALDTRVGCPPGGVLADVGLDHGVVEIVGEVEDMVGDPDLIGHPPGVVDVGHRTAAGVRVPAPQLQGGPDHLVTAVDQ
jgi:hypothetical protein